MAKELHRSFSSYNPTDLAKSLFQEAGDGLFLFEPETGQLIDVNPVAIKLCGFPRDEIIKWQTTQLFQSEADAANQQNLPDAYQKTGMFHAQDGFLLRSKQGNGWIPVNLTITRLHLGAQTLGLITARDIREQRESYAKLKKVEGELRRVLTSVSDCLWSAKIDANGRWIYRFISPVVEKITGRAAEFFLSSLDRWTQVIHPKDMARWQAYIERLRDGQPAQEEYRVIRPDNSQRWVRDSVTVDASQPGVLQIHGVTADITDRRRAAEALRRSEERFRALVEKSSDAIALITPDSTIVYASPSTIAVLGYEVEEAQGHKMSDWVHPDDLPQFLELLQTCRTHAGRSFIGVSRYRHHDGTWRYEEGVFSNRLDDPNVQSIIVNYRDIDERIRAKEELQKAKEAAESANKAKGDFLASMSHEIRTPIAGIMGMTELALATQLTSAQRDYLQTVKFSADALLTIINDILDFSKIEAGKLDLEAIEFSLQDMVGDACKTIALRAQQKGLEISSHICPGVPDRIVGDPHRMRQVVLNLVGNAIKFTEKGEISIRVEYDSENDDDITLLFKVRDTGIGLPPSKHKTIFEAFSQADTSTSRKYGGTGLGLTICARIVGMCGGRIWVESEVGQGSTFLFTSKFGKVADQPFNPYGDKLSKWRGSPVLVVDDNQTIRDSMSETLRAWGLVPSTSSSGRASLDTMLRSQAANKPFSVVLLDGDMPGMGGFAVLGELKKFAQAPPVIMMLTAINALQDQDKLTEHVAAYLSKPIKPVELQTAVLKVFDPSAVPEGGKGPVETDKPPRPLKVLLAEDNPVNQKMAIIKLEKVGHAVTVAGNGKIAVDTLEADNTFDIVLMDVMMPEMDGLEATRLIRQREKETGRGHVPILAMTAMAMKGDKERCQEAGMDAYISKPINTQELFDNIARLVPATAPAAIPSAVTPPAVTPPAVTPPAVTPPAATPAGANGSATPATPSPTTVAPAADPVDPKRLFDQEDAVKRLGDIGELLVLTEMFLEDLPKQLGHLKKSVDQKDAKLLERAAHTLKGSAGILCAKDMAEKALKLEQVGRAGDWESVPAALPALHQAIEQVKPLLVGFCQAHQGKSG